MEKAFAALNKSVRKLAKEISSRVLIDWFAKFFYNFG